MPHGPAMAALTEMQRRFVWSHIFYGLTRPKAARLAGYGNSTALVNIYAISQQPNIKAAFLECGKAIGSAEGAKSLLTLTEIRDNPRAKDADRIRAAELLANRSGLHAITEQHTEVTHTVQTASEAMAKLRALVPNLGLSAEEQEAMLRPPVDLVDQGDGSFAPVAEKRRKAKKIEAAEDVWE
jgi:hypothetical protein